MTGTEVSGLRFALGVLRRFIHKNRRMRPELQDQNDVRAAMRVLETDSAPPHGAGDMPTLVALGEAVCDPLVDVTPRRILRARLALTIRALLRAERGEVERAEKNDEGEWRVIERAASEWLIVCDGCRQRLGPWCGFSAGDTTELPCPETKRCEAVRWARPLWCFDDRDREGLARAHGGRT